jgi:hypothetical protein
MVKIIRRVTIDYPAFVFFLPANFARAWNSGIVPWQYILSNFWHCSWEYLWSLLFLQFERNQMSSRLVKKYTHNLCCCLVHSQDVCMLRVHFYLHLWNVCSKRWASIDDTLLEKRRASALCGSCKTTRVESQKLQSTPFLILTCWQASPASTSSNLLSRLFSVLPAVPTASSSASSFSLPGRGGCR